MFLTDISLKRPAFAFVMIIAFIALGITGYLGLAINDMPEVDIPYIGVNIALTGASPDQVETKVSKKVEEAVGQISGVKHITTTINEGLSSTLIEFNEKKKVDEAAQDVRAKIDGIRDTLPQEIDEPVILKYDINSSPILSLGVTGDLNAKEMSQLIKDKIVPQLNTVNGVGSITTYGLQEREIQIQLDQDKMNALNLTSDQVINRLRSENIENPNGTLNSENREMALRTYGAMKTVNDFNNISLAQREGNEIRVRNVAEVVDGFSDQGSSAYYNGNPCVGIDIINQSGTNTVAVADSVKNKITSIQESLPQGVKINIVADNSTEIRDSVNSVQKTLLEGCILAVLVIFLFLRGKESTAISAIALPTSIITTFAAMKLMNFTLNTLTLLGLSLSVGLLIDDSIVVIENIVRHLRMGKSPVQAAREATSEISLAVMATTFTAVAVFMPISNLGGMIGAVFKEFGLTIAFSVLVSLFVSFTLVPLLASRYVKAGIESEQTGLVGRVLSSFNRQIDRLAEYYKGLIELVLVNRKKTLGITFALFIVSLSLVTQMGLSFQPPEDTGKLTITAGLDSGLNLEAAEQKAKELESIVQKNPNVKSFYTTVRPESATINVKLAAKEERKDSVEKIAAEMRQEMEKIPGLDLSIIRSTDSLASTKDYSLRIQGDDFDQMLAYSQKAKQVLNQIPGAVDVGISYKSGQPETQLVVDQDAASDLGVSTSSISDALSTLVNGTIVGQYQTGENRYDVRVRLKGEQRTNLNSLNGTYLLSSSSGHTIPLAQLVKKVYTTASSTIQRYDKSREIQVQANFVGMTSDDLNSAFLEKLNKELPPPKGIRFGMGDDEAEMQESMGGLLQAIILGILFIFLILAAQFESFLDPLVIMFSLPLAIIGAAVALFITGQGISMLGSIGIIFLMGLVTKNAILLVDFIKKGRAAGQELKLAILEAGSIRLRPILMTSLAMIGGMLPTALALGTGSETRQPMAIAIIGGLVSSTLLTLVIIPVLYTIFDDFKLWWKKKTERDETVIGQQYR
ncbi:MAG: efflux RND transporter permease subunit [Syntrophomonas sp.]